MENSIGIRSSIHIHPTANLGGLCLYLKHNHTTVIRCSSSGRSILLCPTGKPELAEWIDASYLGVGLWVAELRGQHRFSSSMREFQCSHSAPVDSLFPPIERF